MGYFTPIKIELTDDWVTPEEYYAEQRPEQEEEDKGSNLGRGVISGGLSTLAVPPALASMGAKTLGLTGAAEWSAEKASGLLKKASEYQPDTSFKELVSNPSWEGALDWGLYTIGNIAPSMIVGMGGAGLGGKIAAKAFLKKAIEKEAMKGLTLKKAAETAVKKIVGAGQKAGLVASTGAMEGGHMYMTDVEKHGVENARVAPHLLAGTVAGLIELGLGGAEISIINKYLGKGAAKIASKDPKAGVKMLNKIWQVAKTPAGEATQELLQEEIAMLDELFVAKPDEEVTKPFSKEGLWRGAESAAAGLMGGVPGAAGVAATPVRKSIAEGIEDRAKRDEVIAETENAMADMSARLNNPEDNVVNIGTVLKEYQRLADDENMADIRTAMGNMAFDYITKNKINDDVKADIVKRLGENDPLSIKLAKTIPEKKTGEEKSEVIKPDTDVDKTLADLDEYGIPIKIEDETKTEEESPIVKNFTQKMDNRFKKILEASKEAALANKLYGEKIERQQEITKRDKEKIKELYGNNLQIPIDIDIETVPPKDKYKIKKAADSWLEKTTKRLGGKVFINIVDQNGEPITPADVREIPLKAKRTIEQIEADIAKRQEIIKKHVYKAGDVRKSQLAHELSVLYHEMETAAKAEAGKRAAPKRGKKGKDEPFKLPETLKNKVVYNGIQEGFGKIPARHTFTDKNTGSTFLIGLNETDIESKINERLDELDAEFKKKKTAETVIGTFSKRVKGTLGWGDEKIKVLSVAQPKNVRGKVSFGNWAVDYETPSSLGKTGRQTQTKYFGTKKEAIAWVKSFKKQPTNIVPDIETTGKKRASKAKAKSDIKITGGKDKTIETDIPAKKEETLTPKEQKKYLLAEIDAAIEEAKEFEAGDSMMGKRYSLLGDKYGKVTINVPNDGSFTILNVKPVLQEFKKKAKSFPGTKLNNKISSSPTKPRKRYFKQIKRVKGFAGQYRHEYKPFYHKIIEAEDNLQQWYDGNFFFTNKYGIKLKEKPKVRKNIEVNKEKMPDFQGLINKIKNDLTEITSAKSLYVNPDGDENIEPVLEVQYGDGDKSFFEINQVDAITTVHPQAEMKITNDGKTLVFKDKNNVVGLIQAYNGYPFADEYKTQEKLTQTEVLDKPVKSVKTDKTEREPVKTVENELQNFGLKVNKSTDSSGNDIYLLTGNTFEHKEDIKTTKLAKWQPQKKAWGFYEKEGLNRLANKLIGYKTFDEKPESNKESSKPASEEKTDGKRLQETTGTNISDRTKSLIAKGIDYGIPEKIINEQVEDIKKIFTAFNNKKKVFILGNEAGTGKTFVIGGFLREALSSGDKTVTYVTTNQNLISQIKQDLKDFKVADKINFITYAKMREGVKAGHNDIIVFDEGHNIKNITTKQGIVGKKLIQNSDFVLLASATPFENPTEAGYLGATGVFKPAGGFYAWAKKFGASTRTVPTSHGDKEILVWEGSTEDTIAANKWLKDHGLMISRDMQIPSNMVETSFKTVSVDPKWVKLFNTVTNALEEKAAAVNNKMKFMLGGQRTGLQKRILEASKIDAGIELAKKEIADGSQVVIFVETKAKKQKKFQDVIDDPKATGVSKVVARALLGAGINEINIPAAETKIKKAFGLKNTAIYTGSISDKKAQENLQDWRNKKKQVLVVTMDKGGTGLSLHDLIGDRPTTQININLPWKGTKVAQVSGRIARYGLKSKAKVYWLSTDDISFDAELNERVAKRVADMGGIVKGGTGKNVFTKDDIKFETSEKGKAKPLTKETIKKAFSKMSNVATGIDKQGNFWFKFKGFPRFTIHEMDSINNRLGLTDKRPRTGAFLPESKQIWFKTGGEGVKADIGTLHHENYHLFKKIGVVSKADTRAIRRAIRRGGYKGIITEETEASWIGDAAKSREYARDTVIGRIIQKIGDFIDSMVNLLVTTSRGVSRKMESGKMAEQRSLFGREGKAALYGRMPLFEMAGEKAIGADKGALAQAQKMLAEGVDKKEVWRKTGWLKGKEKKDTWKFEIDDSRARINEQELKDTTYRVPLENILIHPELYKAYPELRKVSFTVFAPATKQDSEGRYNHTKNELLLNSEYLSNAKNIILHEVQHAIQEIEGFASGGSPKNAIQIKHVLDLAETKLKNSSDFIEYSKQLNLLFDKNLPKAKFDKELKKLEKNAPPKVKQLWEMPKYEGLSHLDIYRHLAGEIEARDTEVRANLTAKQRREQFPYESQGVSESDWIVTDGSGTSFSVSPKEDNLYKENILFETKELDPFAASPDKVTETVTGIINNLKKSRLGKRFSSEVVSAKDMNLWHKALETPYVLAKKFPAMEKALRTEIRRHENRSQKMFDYYHGDLDKLQTYMRKHPKDLKALEDLTWEWEDKRMPEDEVPTNWYSIQENIDKGETYGDLIINPEHYAEVKKFLLKQGHKENVVDGFITRRKILDEVLVEADKKMRNSNIDLTDLQEFRAYIGKTNNYFPHVREGDSYIRVYDKNTKKVVYREHFYKLKERFLKPENKARQRTKRWVKEQIKSGRLAGKESDYQVGLARTVEKLPDEVYFQIPVEALDQLSKQGGRILAAERVSREAKRLMKIEGLSEKDAHEKAYKLLTADMEKALAKAFSDVLKTRGWGSHAIKRMGVEGYKKDETFRIMFQYLSGYAGFSTKIDAVKEHHETLHDIDAKKQPKLYKYTSDYIRDMTANADKVDNAVDKVRAALFFKFLGGVIKSGLVNLTQNVVMAAPVLSQYTKKSHRKLARAMYDTRKAVTGKNAWLGKETGYKGIPANEIRALHEMVESGAAQDLFLRELKGRVPTSGMGGMINKTLNKAGIFMQIAEKFNRASTGLAAYRIAMNEGAVYDGKSTKNNHDLSVKFAKKAIYDSHFLYGKSNLPAAFRGGDFRKVARAAYTFRSFTHNYLDIMSDMLLNQGTAGKKVIARSLMNIFAVGGLVSIPFFKAFSEMLKYVTDDDDEDLLTQLRAKMPNKFMQDLLVYGIPGATMGVDISGSLSIEVPKNFKDIIGVPYSFGEDTVNMIKSVKAGNMYRAAAETPFTPILIRNAMRGIDLYAKGQTTRAGKEINAPGKKGARKITGFEAVLKSVAGLQPVSVSSGYKAYRASTKMKQGIAERKRALVDRFINARRRNDGEELQKIRREINVWNKKAYHERKPWRVIDVGKMIEYRLKDKGLRTFPKRMRGQAKNIYETWQ